MIYRREWTSSNIVGCKRRKVVHEHDINFKTSVCSDHETFLFPSLSLLYKGISLPIPYISIHNNFPFDVNFSTYDYEVMELSLWLGIQDNVFPDVMQIKGLKCFASFCQFPSPLPFFTPQPHHYQYWLASGINSIIIWLHQQNTGMVKNLDAPFTSTTPDNPGYPSTKPLKYKVVTVIGRKAS